MSTPKKLYFIQEHLNQNYEHGGIGNEDIEKVLIAHNVTPVYFPFQYNFSFKAKLYRIGHLLKMFFTIPAGSIIIFQSPLYAKIHKLLLWFLQYRKKIRIICFIADINGLKHGNAGLLKNEGVFFRRYRYFILHNAAMKNWLDKVVPHYRYSLVYFFDFLSSPFTGTRDKSNQLVFAGNLDKSLFLEKIDQLIPSYHDLRLNLYGPAVTEKMILQKKLNYKGVFNPYELPQIVEGSFGLVWDGDGSFSESDNFAGYMQYITHHKVSLYILSGLPIIIYAKAGSSYLVEEYNIGLTINNLDEIEEKIKMLSDHAYHQMRENMKPLATKISTGGCLSGALEKMLKQIEED